MFISVCLVCLKGVLFCYFNLSNTCIHEHIYTMNRQPSADSSFDDELPRGCCGIWGRPSTFRKNFIHRAKVRFLDHPEDVRGLSTRFIQFKERIHQKNFRSQRNVRWGNNAVVLTAGLLLIITLLNGTIEFFEDSTQVFQTTQQVLTVIFMGMAMSIKKLQLKEKATLYSVSENMLDSMSTYLLTCSGMYSDYRSPHDALKTFWGQFEALAQAIGDEERGIYIHGTGQIQGMEMRLIFAMERAVPELSDTIRNAFVLPAVHDMAPLPDQPVVEKPAVNAALQATPHGTMIAALMGDGAGAGGIHVDLPTNMRVVEENASASLSSAQAPHTRPKTRTPTQPVSDVARVEKIV